MVFLERGIEALAEVGQGLIVIADDPKLDWTQNVLYNSQVRAAQLGFSVAEEKINARNNKTNQHNPDTDHSL